MFRRALLLAVAVAAAALLVPVALAARVHVRVEGKTQTIFGPTAPLVEGGANALSALDAASVAGEFYYHLTQASFGAYVDQIGLYPAGGQAGWVFKVNGASPPVGADQVVLEDGDSVLWYWAEFGPAGGPPTLALRRTGGSCFRVLAQNDAGVATPARGAVLRVDGRVRRTTGGRGCVGRHRGLVRATMTGAVRSNALP